MSLAIVHSRAQFGVEAPAVTVETHLANGLPSLILVGLPETAVKENKDRYAARSSIRLSISPPGASPSTTVSIVFLKIERGPSKRNSEDICHVLASMR